MRIIHVIIASLLVPAFAIAHWWDNRRARKPFTAECELLLLGVAVLLGIGILIAGTDDHGPDDPIIEQESL